MYFVIILLQAHVSRVRTTNDALHQRTEDA